MDSRLPLILVLAAMSPTALGEIYKTVDANGNVVYTDIAPIDRTGPPAQPVTVEPINSYAAPPAVAPDATAAPAASGSAIPYARIDVISPTEDETIRDNAGNVEIQVSTQPRLRATHRLLLVLDGEPTEIEAVQGVFALTNVDRGTHTAAGRIVDSEGNVLIESNPTTFNLMRVSIESTNRVPTPH